MLINADFSRPARVCPADYQWVSSPQSGVERVMLDRIGAEKARATSLVCYQPASRFPLHHHPGGEEILVLAGTFSEGENHYPAGWYMRNPDGTSHAPSSEEGATIFVKLRQMRAHDNRVVRIDTRAADNWHQHNGRAICLLYESAEEHVSLQRVNAGERLFSDTLPGGAEILLLAGSLHEHAADYPAGSWLRLPAGEQSALVAGEAGASFWLKSGHLHPATLTGVSA